MENSQYQAILQRFKSAVAQSQGDEEFLARENVPVAGLFEEPEAVQAQGLEPLPQPELESKKAKPMVLNWIVSPIEVDAKSSKLFSDLSVEPWLVNRLKEMGYIKSFAVQTAIIPVCLQGQARLSPDPLPAILVNSPTGSGKTLSYGVPIVQTLASRTVQRLRALILLPTRVLIMQVAIALSKLAEGTTLKVLGSGVEFGGTVRTPEEEHNLLRDHPPDILVISPHRLTEYLAVIPDLLQDLRFLVVDEADRLVSDRFDEWTSVLASKHPVQQRPADALSPWKRPLQRMVFSATLSRDMGQLTALQVTKPFAPRIYVVYGMPDTGKFEYTLPSTLHEEIAMCPSSSLKPLALVTRLKDPHAFRQALVFVRSNESAIRLARLVELIAELKFSKRLVARRCSGEDKTENIQSVLSDFKEGKIDVLVSTDMVARGIDITGLPLVVNYDLPSSSREYVHRVGRTARAGARGKASSLVTSEEEINEFWDMQTGIGRVNTVHTYNIDVEADEKYNDALSILAREVKGTQINRLS